MVDVIQQKTHIEGVDRAVFVAGHPRSGTSATCRLVATDSEVTWLTDSSGSHDNVYGYFEHEDLLEWSLAVQQGGMAQWNVDALDDLMELIHHAIGGGVLGTKMLHTGALSYWGTPPDGESDAIVKDLRVVVIFRHPAASYSSMWGARRTNWPIGWWRTYNFVLAYYDRHRDDVAFVSHERLMNKPDAVADMLERELDLDVDPSVIDPDQQTVKKPTVEAGDLAKRIYRKLRQLEDEQYE